MSCGGSSHRKTSRGAVASSARKTPAFAEACADLAAKWPLGKQDAIRKTRRGHDDLQSVKRLGEFACQDGVFGEIESAKTEKETPGATMINIHANCDPMGAGLERGDL